MKLFFISLSLIITLAHSELIRDNKNEVLLDTDKKLMWQDNINRGESNWQNAVNTCKNSNFAGYDDWRLPDYTALNDLYLKRDSLQSLKSPYIYWSSSSVPFLDAYAFGVVFKPNTMNVSYDKNVNFLYLCVRDMKEHDITKKLSKDIDNEEKNKNLVTTNDLDDLLNKTQQADVNPKKWLFVVGIEKYKNTENIVFATRSAEMYVKIAQKMFGISKQNSYVLLDEDATATEIKSKMKMMLRNVKEGDAIYFYYNGHGVPAVDKDNEPFILSNDMYPDLVSDEPMLMMRQMYNDLSDSKASSIIAIIDSCFSGGADGQSIQKGVAATRIKPKNVSFNKNKMVILTAGRDTQYSNAYNQKAHRLFSYFVMEALLKGERNIKDLYGEVYKNSKETTRTNYGDMRLQEPTMEGNSNIKF